MLNHHRASIVDHPDFRLYDFGKYHPLRPERIDAGLSLLRESGLWCPRDELLVPQPATQTELELVHDQNYISVVERAGKGDLSPGVASRFGLASTDNPPFPNMHYAASLVAGGAADGVRAVMEGDLDHVFHPAGGLHHAGHARASGFCIYNDPALAAAIAARQFGARVLCIDLDCHHGDGVQWIFYDDPAIFTLSFHESGKFLFPGTGAITENGEDAGAGFCLNVPFYPYTRDDSWQSALDGLLLPVFERFQPDLVISNHGCDTHDWDPITHLSLTTRSFQHQVQLIHKLAHAFCAGRWLAVGSGGYDWRRVVPRSWSIVWAEMTQRSLPDRLPLSWTTNWFNGIGDPTPDSFLDEPSIVSDSEHAEEIARINRATIDAALSIVRRE